MQAADAADTIKEVRAEEEPREATGLRKFENQAALLIAILAMLLAITAVAGSDNLQAILQSETEVTNTWAFFQAKNVRRTSTILQRENWELMLATQGASWSPDQRRQVEEKIAAWNSEIDRYRNEPEEGTVDLSKKAREIEAKLERALRQDPNFDFAEGLFQIAIVVASVSILTKLKPLFLAALVMGGLAAFLMLNGFYLFVDIPFFAG